MKNFNKQGRQGDVYFRKVDQFPEAGLIESKAVNNEHIVAHSETGHHHVLPQSGVKLFTVNGNPLLMYVEVTETVELSHKRSFDTHETVLFEPGRYEFRRAREYTPEGWVRISD